MVTRVAKILLLAAIAFFYAILVLDNVTDYGSNYQFVHHVLMMDSTFPQNREMWRALNASAWHHAFYLSIILWEIVTAGLCWAGVAKMASRLHAQAVLFNKAKAIAIAGLTMSLLMWLVAFLTIGGEWFLMWQSKLWNGQDAAFRMFAVVGITMMILTMRDVDEQA